MAKAFFASAWADQQEEKDDSDETKVNLSGCEIFNVMPDEIDSAAIHAANTLYMDFERALHSAHGDNDTLAGQWVDECLNTCGCSYEEFGHYSAMQAMGSGVGLYDKSVPHQIADHVPHCEFGSHSLEKDY